MLPADTPAEPSPAAPPPSAQPSAGAATWYRSDQQRVKSVRRRANPWYRRLARGLVALSLLAVLGVGLYYGAREVQDYLERDRLPGPGAEVPDIRATSFQVRSSSPAPEVDGTLTIDTVSRAFEFVGRNGGPQSGLRAVTTDGSSIYVSQDAGAWRLVPPDDRLRVDLQAVAFFLSESENADAVLTSRIRRGFVELIEQASEGLGDNELTRYELELDTQGLSRDYPLQWQDFQRRAIPNAPESRALSVIIWIDTDDVLVRVRDEQSNWSWERLTYADTPFEPTLPADELLEATTVDPDASTDSGADDDADDDSGDG